MVAMSRLEKKPVKVSSHYRNVDGKRVKVKSHTRRQKVRVGTDTKGKSAEEIHEARPPKAQAADESQQAQKVTEDKGRWAGNMNRMDYEGVDTKEEGKDKEEEMIKFKKEVDRTLEKNIEGEEMSSGELVDLFKEVTRKKEKLKHVMSNARSRWSETGKKKHKNIYFELKNKHGKLDEKQTKIIEKLKKEDKEKLRDIVRYNPDYNPREDEFIEN